TTRPIFYPPSAVQSRSAERAYDEFSEEEGDSAGGEGAEGMNAIPEPHNEGITLSCICCGTRLPNKSGDAIWACLACSIVDAKEIICVCAQCELMNRRGSASHSTHRHDHPVVQVRPWYNLFPPSGTWQYTPHPNPVQPHYPGYVPTSASRYDHPHHEFTPVIPTSPHLDTPGSDPVQPVNHRTPLMPSH
ncbi:hypothetical protein WG66_002662, partial [Moniliophthora roreri]